MFCSLGALAQSNTTVTVKVNQADALELDATGEPAQVGDVSKFELTGGTPPYSDYTWTQVSQEGKTHEVSVQDANNCTVSIFVNVEGFSDIPNLEFEQKNPYPNPATDIVNIPMPAGEEKAVVLIINADGRVLYKNTVETILDTYPLTLSSCEPGKILYTSCG
ncbi:MAG: T9SS type A sorting domain-containing protein [Bacteroidales bacterium]|nr:T9SS type A sorting domain-containing protein [Bacteroidales bacterium]